MEENELIVRIDEAIHGSLDSTNSELLNYIEHLLEKRAK